jgi:polysaccharide export outer membrane protein
MLPAAPRRFRDGVADNIADFLLTPFSANSISLPEIAATSCKIAARAGGRSFLRAVASAGGLAGDDTFVEGGSDMRIRKRWLSRALASVALLSSLLTGCQVDDRWLDGSMRNQHYQAHAGERTAGERSGVIPAEYQQTDETTLGQPTPLPNHSVPPGTPGCPVPPPGVDAAYADLPIPTEKAKTAHPAYIIEPPDILFILPVRLTPKPPYRIEPLDVLQIQVAESLPNQPINGPYVISPEGMVNLGYGYGQVRVAGLTIEQAAEGIRKQLERSIKMPQVSVSLLQFRGVQQTAGEHLVGQDGTITLGSYGSVFVTGMTLCQAKAAIERHLSQWLLNPEISLSINAYNSKVYYVITDGAGYGQTIHRFPITGNETVLDAISLNGGIAAVSSRRRIWVARPGPAGAPCYHILPVFWDAVVMGGDTTTNYQLFPGDRIFISSDPLITLDNSLAKLFAPVERVLGLILLGATTYYTVNGQAFNNNNNNNGIR